MNAVPITTGGPPLRRSKPVLGGLSVLLALWFGLSAPPASPVLPVAPTVVPAVAVQQDSAELDPGAVVLPFGPGPDLAHGNGRGRR